MTRSGDPRNSLSLAELVGRSEASEALADIASWSTTFARMPVLEFLHDHRLTDITSSIFPVERILTELLPLALRHEAATRLTRRAAGAETCWDRLAPQTLAVLPTGDPRGIDRKSSRVMLREGVCRYPSLGQIGLLDIWDDPELLRNALAKHGMRQPRVSYVSAEILTSIHEMVTGEMTEGMRWMGPTVRSVFSRGLDLDLELSDLATRLDILLLTLPPRMRRALMLRAGMENGGTVIRKEAAGMLGVTYGQLLGLEREASVMMARPLRALT